MDSISLEQLKSALIHTSQLIVDSEGYLTKLDSVIGDGDHGTSMQSGFTALGELLSSNNYSDACELFVASGTELLRVMGGASGVIFGTMFIGGREAVKGKTQVSAEDLTLFFEQSANSIMKRGHSGPGDKTMLDALIPAVEAMKHKLEQNSDISKVLLAGCEGAKAGFKNTESMLPRTGRSKNFREEALGAADAGAASVSIFFEGISEYVKNLADI